MKNLVGCISQSLIFLSLLIPITPDFVSADVQITGFSNFTFGTWSGTGDMVLSDDLCVYNSTDANYKVTATASGGSFLLVDGGNTIAYEVRFKKNGGVYALLTHGTPSSTINGADTSSANCSGGVNSTLQITVTEAALGAATSGTYSATLTLVLEPA